MIKRKKLVKDTLIAVINDKKDFNIALNQNWYRIPANTKPTPLIVKDKKLEYIGFYLTSVFNESAFKIEWYSKVKKIDIVKRYELFPEEPQNEKTNEEYYKIEFEKCEKLVRPIVSLRHRRMLFVTTNFNRFLESEEFNDLFIESPIEEKVWGKFKLEGIEAERQFLFQADEKFYYLDFALFCKNRNIDIECDGDDYHLSSDAVKYDKKRNNELEKFGWGVLRYHTDEIVNNIEKVIMQIKETVNRYGGLDLATKKNYYKIFPTDSQLQLFE